MIKNKKAVSAMMALIMILTSGCTLFKNPVDKRTGFSESLSAVEEAVTGENYDDAAEKLAVSMKKWERIKPFMQIEVDHDIVNDIESEFTALSAYIETRNKSLALASIRIIINMWSEIGTK